MSRLTNKFLLAYLFVPILVLSIFTIGGNHYVYLSYAFLKGSISYVKIPPNLADVTYFHGKYFWTNGPFPSVLLLPFVWIFNTNFHETFFKFPFTLLNFWLVFQIAKSLKLSSIKSVWLAIFYIFGSIYTPVAIMPYSVYLSGIIANSLMLFAIYEFLNKRRWFLISIALAFAILTRFPPSLATIFFAAYLIQKPINIGRFAKFAMPLLAVIIFLGFYNWARFGNVFETGHKYQLIAEEQSERRRAGIFSLKHLSANLYYMFIKTPDPVFENSLQHLKPPYLKYDDYGMSIFILSPVLFLLVKTNLKEKYVKMSLITIFAMLIPIITYYSLGYKQIGYWHALDVFPFLLFPLVSAVKKINQNKLQFLVILGIVITWFFIVEMLATVAIPAPLPFPKHFLPHSFSKL